MKKPRRIEEERELLEYRSGQLCSQDYERNTVNSGAVRCLTSDNGDRMLDGH